MRPSSPNHPIRPANGAAAPGLSRGVTLIEMLVVVAILMLLLGVALPSMQGTMDDRRSREAARAVNVYCGSARGVAMGTGRPCGVMIRRMDNERGCSMVLEQVEVPPPYAGESIDARAQLTCVNIEGGVATVQAGLSGGGINPDLVHKGDRVRFNHQGPLYTIAGQPSANAMTLVIDIRDGQMLPWPTVADVDAPSEPVPFEIHRQPTKSFADPLELPTGAVIDLEASGTDDHVIGPGNGEPVYILFSPNGSVDRVYHDGHLHPATETIFLLIGKREKVPAVAGEENFRDMTSLWVALNPRTGLVTTSNVGTKPTNTTGIPGDLADSRYYAINAESAGGR
ncbi:MAG TPA: prepilin-type N-terminal cleavage/methylation domain-containing protein [Thermoguttaceae bacterium]|nr:prepilin-type N-terminal cleavage/methylation domain-containing protein [Thermoguttaceae bacterium]